MIKISAKTALQLRNREYGALKIASHWAAADEIKHPYWLKNLHTYQNIMAKAAGERAALLMAYINQRKARAA